MRTENRHLSRSCSSCNGMADSASLFIEIREFISCDINTRSTFDGLEFYVWEDVPAGGLLTCLYLFRSWSNSISGGGFIWRFLHAGVLLCLFTVSLFLTLVKIDGLPRISNLISEY